MLCMGVTAFRSLQGIDNPERCELLAVAFPLTPALSLGEREDKVRDRSACEEHSEAGAGRCGLRAEMMQTDGIDLINLCAVF